MKRNFQKKYRKENMKIEFRMDDDTNVIMEDNSNGVDVNFTRSSINSGDYKLEEFLIKFRTDEEVKEFMTAFKLLTKGFINV